MADNGILVSGLSPTDTIKNDSKFLLSQRGDGEDRSYLSRSLNYSTLSSKLSLDLDIFTSWQQISCCVSSIQDLSSNTNRSFVASYLSTVNSLSNVISSISKIKNDYISSQELIDASEYILKVRDFPIDVISSDISRLSTDIYGVEEDAESGTESRSGMCERLEVLEDVVSSDHMTRINDLSSTQSTLSSRIITLSTDISSFNRVLVAVDADHVSLSSDTNTLAGSLVFGETGKLSKSRDDSKSVFTIQSDRSVGEERLPKTAKIDVVVKEDGSAYVEVPEITDTSGCFNKNYSATTKWVSDITKADTTINNVVHKDGTETIDGVKTFKEISAVTINNAQITQLSSDLKSISDVVTGSEDDSLTNILDVIKDDILSNKTDIETLSSSFASLKTDYSNYDKYSLEYDNESKNLMLKSKDELSTFSTTSLEDLDCRLLSIYLSSGVMDHESHESGYDKYVVIKYKNGNQDELCLSNLYQGENDVKVENWKIGLGGTVGSSTKPVYLSEGKLSVIEKIDWTILKNSMGGGSGDGEGGEGGGGSDGSPTYITNEYGDFISGTPGFMTAEDKYRLDFMWKSLSAIVNANLIKTEG